MPKHTAEQIENVASSLMPNFIPRDKTRKNLAFAFTLDGVNYEVIFEKNSQDVWRFISAKPAD